MQVSKMQIFKIKKILKKVFKFPENFLRKIGLPLRGNYIDMFLSEIRGFVVHLFLKTLKIRYRKIYHIYWSFFGTKLDMAFDAEIMN